MPQNRRGNGNIYDLRQDLRRDPQRPAAPSQQSGTPRGARRRTLRLQRGTAELQAGPHGQRRAAPYPH